jgi:hypothetical protein
MAVWLADAAWSRSPELVTPEKLGCTFVLLDTFYSGNGTIKRQKTAWRMLAGIADNRLDLAVRTVRWGAVSEWIFRCAEVREDKVRLG